MANDDISEAVDAYLASLDADDEDTLRINATDLADKTRFVRAVPLTLNGVIMDDGRAEALRHIIALRAMAKTDSVGWRSLMTYVNK